MFGGVQTFFLLAIFFWQASFVDLSDVTTLLSLYYIRSTVVPHTNRKPVGRINNLFLDFSRAIVVSKKLSQKSLFQV